MILITRRKPFLWSSPPIRPKKGLNFWLRHFWSAGMVAARWNLFGTECGPLVQKVADPWPMKLVPVVRDYNLKQCVKTFF